MDIGKDPRDRAQRRYASVLGEERNLRDLVMDEAARRGIARERLWEWVLLVVPD
jgi:hypothetical protein